MRFNIQGTVYDVSNIVDAPIDVLIELHRISGMEGQDILDGLAESAQALQSGRMPGHGALMATAAVVWLGKTLAGDKPDSLEAAAAGLALTDIVPVPDVAPPAAGQVVPSDPPTPPASVPATVVVDQPVTAELPSPSPGPTSPIPSPVTASPSGISGQE